MFPSFARDNPAYSGLTDSESFGKFGLQLSGTISDSDLGYLLNGDLSGCYRAPNASAQSFRMHPRIMKIPSRQLFGMESRSRSISNGSAALFISISRIVLVGSGEKVISPNTQSPIASMACQKWVWVLSCMKKQGYSVGPKDSAISSSSDPHLAVAFGFAANPRPAISIWSMPRRLINILPESLYRPIRKRGERFTIVLSHLISLLDRWLESLRMLAHPLDSFNFNPQTIQIKGQLLCP